MDLGEGEEPPWSEGVQRELQRLEQACGPERLPPVLELSHHQRELVRRAEAPFGGAPDVLAATPGLVAVVSRSELEDADAERLLQREMHFSA